jgi:filamentous hemagglutinin family protein
LLYTIPPIITLISRYDNALGLTADQTANFLSSPQVHNILGRVTGGSVSIIDGLLQVSGGNSNLFLVNPTGIVFGSHASLNLPGSFTATTANGIQFGSNWFNASGANDYSSLIGNPSTFAFTTLYPGAILNAGGLATVSGQDLTLMGGTVISTGQLMAPQGHILVSAVPGNSWVRISPPGQTIGLEIHAPKTGMLQPSTWSLPIATLPELLTGQGGADFPGVVVSANGQVSLTGSNIPVETGDLVTHKVSAEAATLSSANNLTLVESQLHTTGDLNLHAASTVRVRDSIANPFVARAQGNLYIQGDQGIDILALNHPGVPFQSGGNLTLASQGIVSGDAHFSSGGRFSILNLAGQPGAFVSFYDPIISATGDVTFGDYTGAALKVETLGSISAGNITITSPDTSLSGSDPDIPVLTSSRALILRAGLTSLSNPANVSQSQPVGSFTSSATATAPGTITAKAIKTVASTTENVDGGVVILDAPSDIRADSIDSSSSLRNGGTVSVSSNSGRISIGSLNSSSQRGNGGPISIDGNSGNIIIGSLDSSSQTGNGGTITIDSNSGSINTGSVNSSSQAGNGGTVAIDSNSGSTNTGSVNSSSQTGNGGTVAIDSNSGAINTGSVNSSSQTGNGGAVTIDSNSGSINTGSVNVSSQTGNQGTVTFSSNSGNITTGSSSTSASVISTNPQNSTSTTQPTKTLSGIPSDIPYSNLPEISRNPEITAESIERQRGKEFEDILGKKFPEKFTDAKDIQYALHSLENQFEEERRYLKVPTDKKTRNLRDKQNTTTRIVPRRPAVVYTIMRSNRTQIVVETSEGGYPPITVDATIKELLSEVAKLQKAANQPGIKLTDTVYAEPSQKLYDWLLKPLEILPLCEMQKENNKDCISTLLFSPDASLRLIPLAGLLDKSPKVDKPRGYKTFLEKYDVSISLIPSLNYTDVTYSDITENQILSLGSTSTSYENNVLAAVPLELKSIQSEKVWSGDSANIIMDEAFTFNSLKARSQTRPFRIVHIATHAGFEENQDKKQDFYIYFGGKDKSTLENLLNLNWKNFRLDLLVLSACNTLEGLNYKGERRKKEEEQERIFVSLPAKIGVKSVLASIWNVNDPGALIFMTLFYKNLKGGMSKSEALKDAQLALKNGVSIDELTSLERLLIEELRQKQGRNIEINQRLLLIAGFFS